MTGSIIRRKIWGRMLSRAGALLFWLAVWWLAGKLVNQELMLVSPARAFRRLAEMSVTVSFWSSVLASCLRVAAGFLMALAFGGILAWLTHRFIPVRILLSPLLNAVRATPVASFIMLALIWLGRDSLPIFISFLMVTPLVWANLASGLDALDRRLLEMAAVFRFSRGKKLRNIILPGLLPYLTAACSTGLGFAWKSAVAAEIIALPTLSIGRQLNNARIYLETPDLLAWTIAVILLSILIEKGTVATLTFFFAKKQKSGST